jgi:hypothetical protein
MWRKGGVAWVALQRNGTGDRYRPAEKRNKKKKPKKKTDGAVPAGTGLPTSRRVVPAGTGLYQHVSYAKGAILAFASLSRSLWIAQTQRFYDPTCS